MSKPTHENIVEFKVYGEDALFSDVLTRTGMEKYSYPIPTYEALKGIMHSIYWKPTIVWYIDAVRVMNRIQTQRRGIRPIHYSGGNDLSYCTYLRDVCYHVRAHFEWNDNRPELEHDRNENKHHNIAKRMIERGGRRDIFLGTRECMGYVEPCAFEEGTGFYDHSGELPYGLFYHGITYAEKFGTEGAFITKCTSQIMRDLGCIQSPQSAFILNLGLESLHVRMPRHVENGQAVAEFLEKHEKVEYVNYPTLPSNKYYEIAKKYGKSGKSVID